MSIKPEEVIQMALEAMKRKSNDQPIGWGMLSKDGCIYDIISPEEHAKVEGEYTVPLYTHPLRSEKFDHETPAWKHAAILETLIGSNEDGRAALDALYSLATQNTQEKQMFTDE
jgi:hypothetical protein